VVTPFEGAPADACVHLRTQSQVKLAISEKKESVNFASLLIPNCDNLSIGSDNTTLHELGFPELERLALLVE
jgi:hypothetical protein